MVLTQEELRSLVEVKNRSPHQLLGLHVLGKGKGLVARALLPGADKVRAPAYPRKRSTDDQP